MNDIYHKQYVLEFDVWDPQRKTAEAELDQLVFDLKNKALLPHVGNVKLTPMLEKRISTPSDVPAPGPVDHLPDA